MPWHSRGWSAHVMVMIGVLCLAVGCSSKPKPTADAKSVSGTDEQIFLGDTIEKNYDPNVIMKRGEALLRQGEEFAEAIVEYQHFLELHRAHPLAVYAQYRLAEAISGWQIDRPGPGSHTKKRLLPSKSLEDFPGKVGSPGPPALSGLPRLLAQTHLFVGQFTTAVHPYLARHIALT